jgi:hypothetical protein
MSDLELERAAMAPRRSFQKNQYLNSNDFSDMHPRPNRIIQVELRTNHIYYRARLGARYEISDDRRYRPFRLEFGLYFNCRLLVSCFS